MKSLLKLALVASVALPALTTPVVAGGFVDKAGLDTFAKERFQIRFRGIGVLPESEGSTTINGTPDPDNAFVPELDFTYFITNNWAMELIAAVSPHDVGLKDSDAGDLDLGDIWLLPPTLTLQYHFTPEKQFSPYLGAGINYTVPFGEDDGRDVTDLEVDPDFGYAVQAGFDYWINDNWGFNMDVKKLWLDLDASVNNGGVTGNVELDPVIAGVGISYRF